MSKSPENQEIRAILEIRAIRVRSPHVATEICVDVQLKDEDFFRAVFVEEVVDGVLISHEILPLGMRAGDRLDF